MKTINCCVCSAEVTKRSSIYVELPEKSIKGRCCRSHDEAAEYLLEIENKKTWEKASDELTVISAVSAVRCMNAIRGIPVAYLLMNTRRSLHKSNKGHLYNRIESQVTSQGSMTSEEITASLLHFSSFKQLTEK